MKAIRSAVAFGLLLALLVAGSIRASAQTAAEIEIVHTPPAEALPGLQINLTAVLVNASAASVSWNNGSMASDSLVPMTNTSQPSGGGWIYDAWLPAQTDGVQVSYSINASNGAGNRVMSYFLVVSAPTPQGLTAADQYDWALTVAAMMSMAISTLAVLYWYTGRRLRREG